MARKFEEIEVWQLARQLVKNIYSLTAQDNIRKHYSLIDQIQRASLSVMNNVAEGFERFSAKEFIYLLNVSKGSAGEVRSMLYVLSDLNLIDPTLFKTLQDQTYAISKSLAGFISYLKKADAKTH
jgi:four helix bundle protein